MPLLAPMAFLGLKSRLAERLGLSLPDPCIQEGSIWVHALSVGEVISAVPMIQSLRCSKPDRQIVLSVATKTGMKIARERLLSDVVRLFYMPLDLWWYGEALISRLKPSVFVLVETDIWPGILWQLRRKGIPCFLVNGRVSPKTYKNYARFPRAAKWVFRNFSKCLMQSQGDRERLLRTAGRASDVLVTGNIKFDRDWKLLDNSEKLYLLRLFGFDSDDPVWVAGSTHRGEDKIILEVFAELLKNFPRLRLVLAPRLVEEAGFIIKAAREMNIKAALRSHLPESGLDRRVVVIDTVGELERIYGLAQVSFVGGSLVPFGGHNLLEPASHGSVVIFGPYTHNFEEMTEMLLAAGAGVSVKDKTELHWVMMDLLADHERCIRIGKKARNLVTANKGALERVVGIISSCL